MLKTNSLNPLKCAKNQKSHSLSGQAFSPANLGPLFTNGFSHGGSGAVCGSHPASPGISRHEFSLSGAKAQSSCRSVLAELNPGASTQASPTAKAQGGERIATSEAKTAPANRFCRCLGLRGDNAADLSSPLRQVRFPPCPQQAADKGGAPTLGKVAGSAAGGGKATSGGVSTSKFLGSPARPVPRHL